MEKPLKLHKAHARERCTCACSSILTGIHTTTYFNIKNSSFKYSPGNAFILKLCHLMYHFAFVFLLLTLNIACTLDLDLVLTIVCVKSLIDISNTTELLHPLTV